MLDVDIERSLLDHLETNLPSTLRVHYPGETFSPERSREWIEVRIRRIERYGRSRPGAETDRLFLEVRCFVKVQHKGGRRLELSALVDTVRAVVDSTLGAPAAVVYDTSVPPVGVGMVIFGPAHEARDYGVAIPVDEVDVPGLDLAILEIEAQLTGDP